MIVIDEIFSRFFTVSPAGIGAGNSSGLSGRRPAEAAPGAPASAMPDRGRLGSLLGGLFGGAKPAAAAPEPMAWDECAAVARLICALIRGGHYEDARAMLKPCLERCPDHAPFLNLAGAVCEAESDWRMARRYYGRAVAADRRSADAQQNLRRIFELFTYGASREPIALGDESADGRIPVLHEFPIDAEAAR